MVQTNLIDESRETHYGNRDLCRGMVREAAANGEGKTWRRTVLTKDNAIPSDQRGELLYNCIRLPAQWGLLTRSRDNNSFGP